ncbi:MAG: tripartite tricarboxylate transporter substrate binding protein, partial [Betaproteobacteria bacterium]|nr:tripartite tricarboxylate transporter substrate binding protein [Betaproteobacteria bacterium]
PMSKALGQPVVVDNRPGAYGAIATELVTKAPADGYTLLIASTGVMSQLPATNPKLPYDVQRDLVAVVRVAVSPQVLIVNPSLPVKTTREFIAFARAKPGGALMAFAGTGTNLMAESFTLLTGVHLVTVPYAKGSAPAMVDLIGGRVDGFIDQVTSALNHIRSGRVRAIAVTTAKRAAQLPEVPTLAESGVPGFEASTVTGIYAPAATRSEIVARLNAVVVDVLNTVAVKERLATVGAEAAPSSSEELGAFIRNDIARWKKVIREAGIKTDSQ